MKETVIDAFADKAVLERLFTNGPGELLAVNSKAGYLKAGQDVYMLCSADLGIFRRQWRDTKITGSRGPAGEPATEAVAAPQ